MQFRNWLKREIQIASADSEETKNDREASGEPLGRETTLLTILDIVNSNAGIDFNKIQVDTKVTCKPKY